MYLFNEATWNETHTITVHVPDRVLDIEPGLLAISATSYMTRHGRVTMIVADEDLEEFATFVRDAAEIILLRRLICREQQLPFEPANAE